MHIEDHPQASDLISAIALVLFCGAILTVFG